MMRPASRWSAWLAIALLSGCATRVVEVPPDTAAKSARDAVTLSAIEALGRSGDWLVIRGYHATDNLVASLTNKPFSHAAVLDLERDQVIEAEAHGVHTSTLSAFVAKSHRLLLIRPAWADAHGAEAAVRKARSLVGRQYDFLGLIGFNIPDRYYCSELVLEVYRPFMRPDDFVPRPVEPGQLYHYGRILFDNGPL
jgi:permuted papain-like amidase YaeF/Yiix C92 family enzyme